MSGDRANAAVRMLPFDKAVSALTASDAQMHPDGDVIAYVVSAMSHVEELPTSSIWLVTTDGAVPRRVTGGDTLDTHPRWSPAGDVLAFLSDRQERGVFQVYLLPSGGGDGIRVTSAAAGVRSFAWAPDGTTIAYVALDPESDDDKRRREEREDWIVRDADPRRNGLYVIDIDLPAPMTAEASIPEPRRISPPELHVSGYVDAGYAWAPDSRALVAMAGPSPRTNDRIRSHMYLFGLDGSTTDLGVFEGLTYSPRFSHDGSRLAYIGAQGQIPARWVLQTIPLAGGKPTVVAPGFVGAFQSVAWLPDGDRLLAQVETFQQESFLVSDLESGALAPAWSAPALPGTAGSAPTCSRDGRRWLMSGPTLPRLATCGSPISMVSPAG